MNKEDRWGLAGAGGGRRSPRGCVLPQISLHRRVASEAMFAIQPRQVVVPLFPRSPFGKHASYNNHQLRFETMKLDHTLIRHAKERSGRRVSGSPHSLFDIKDDSVTSLDESEQLRDVSQLQRERLASLREAGDLLYGPHRVIKLKRRWKQSL